MTPTAQLRLISEVQKQPWVRVKDLMASLELVNICVHEATARKTFKKRSVPVMGHHEITCCCCWMKRSLTLHSSIGEMWSDETKNYQERACSATSALNGAQHIVMKTWSHWRKHHNLILFTASGPGQPAPIQGTDEFVRVSKTFVTIVPQCLCISRKCVKFGWRNRTNTRASP